MHARVADSLRLLASLLVVAILGLIAWKIGLFKPAGIAKVSELAGHTGGSTAFMVAFIFVYASIASLALPVGPLAYGAGAVFGFIRASIVIWIASMIGATTGYLLARYVWAGGARALLGRHQKKLKDLRQGNPALIAFRMQVLPLVPFGVFNYAAALSKLPIGRFLLGTAIGIIPGTLLSAYIGDRLIAGVHGESRKPLFVAISIGLLLLAVSFLPGIVDRFKRR